MRCRIGTCGGIGLPPRTIVVVVFVVGFVVVGVIVVVVVNSYKSAMQDWHMWWNWSASRDCCCHRGSC